mgnify:CR=1 FL=1
MSSPVRALLVGLVVGLFVSVMPSCSGSAPACDATSCSNGCCTATGECITSRSQSQCGNGGATCMACSSNQSCTNGTCVTTSAGGGSGTGGGTGTGGGSGTGGGMATGGGTGTGGGTAGGTAGGSAGGSAGGTAGGSGGAGGGGFPLDGGVALTFMTTCPAFTACGGNVNPSNPTTWDITGACIDDATFSLVVTGLDTFCGTAATTVSNKNGRIQGTAVFTASTVARNAMGFVSFTASHPNCPTACGFISPSVLAMYGLSGSCSLNGAACDCSLSLPLGSNTNDTYTVNGGTLSIMTAARTRTFDYCITTAGTPTLTYRETTQASMTPPAFYPDPGVITLTR